MFDVLGKIASGRTTTRMTTTDMTSDSAFRSTVTQNGENDQIRGVKDAITERASVPDTAASTRMMRAVLLWMYFWTCVWMYDQNGCFFICL